MVESSLTNAGFNGEDAEDNRCYSLAFINDCSLRPKSISLKYVDIYSASR